LVAAHLFFYCEKELLDITGHVEHHYTSKTCNEDQVWFHDGILTGWSMLYDGAMTTSNNVHLSVCRGKKAIAAVYNNADTL
jgi:hypothetical protein